MLNINNCSEVTIVKDGSPVLSLEEISKEISEMNSNKGALATPEEVKKWKEEKKTL